MYKTLCANMSRMFVDTCGDTAVEMMGGVCVCVKHWKHGYGWAHMNVLATRKRIAATKTYRSPIPTG